MLQTLNRQLNRMMPLITPTSYTMTGFILAAAIPTGISSFVWVGIHKGNIALTLSVILIDTLLAPVAVPVVLGMVFQQMMVSLVGLVLGRQARARQRRTDTASAA